jgi:hypothetical protein
MMKQKSRCVLLSVACILVVFCAVRAVKRPMASDAAQRIEAGASRTLADESVTDARFPVTATDNLRLTQLETARRAQRIKQQEAARELQHRQQETIHPLS